MSSLAEATLFGEIAFLGSNAVVGEPDKGQFYGTPLGVLNGGGLVGEHLSML
jgi:hypothetical protein